MAKTRKPKTPAAPAGPSSFDEEGVVDITLPDDINIWQKPDTTSRGILLFATGHPYYGECAVRLAASLKYAQPDLKISVVSDAPAQVRSIDLNRQLFDRIITPESRHILQNGKRVDIRAKIFAAEISPYYETLMLDVDMLWLPKKKPAEFFDKMKGTDFYIQNTGFADLGKEEVDNQVFFYWAKISDVKAAYEFKEGKFYQMTGEWVYFKKTDRVKQWFSTVQEVYDNCKVKSIGDFANQTTTDELAYSIASVITGLYPSIDSWLPVYWPYRSKALQARMGTSYLDLANDFYAMSFGGNLLPGNYKHQYELLAEAYFSKLSITAPFKLGDKRTLIPERRKI